MRPERSPRMDFEMHHLVVPRTARFATAGGLGDGVEEVVFLCHGYGQLASEILDAARVLVRDRLLLVAPEALSRFYLEDHRRVGASWMTREDREREMTDYVRYLDLVHERVFAIVARSRVTLRLLGFSQGVATAARWAVRGAARVDHLILWGSTLPPELDDEPSLAMLRSMRVSLVGGSRDGFLGEAEREEQRVRLSRHGVVFEELRFEGGHRLDNETLKRLVSTA
jgi:predicted esterase